MATSQDRASTITRVAQVALILNAVAATIPAIGFAFGLLPHAGDQPLLARRAAAGEAAGVFVMLFVAARLRQNRTLIWLPLVFVGLQLAASIVNILANHDDVAPAIIEGLFFTVYVACATSAKRGG